MFYACLDDIRSQLEGTAQAILENDVKWRIITSIPTGSDWKQACHLCLLNDLGTSEVIETLQSYQDPLVQPAPSVPATAALSSTDREPSGCDNNSQRGGSRGRMRGSRGGQSRGGKRGGRAGKSS
jgi:hypothetical protein